jgi:hypothetical protein
MTLATIISLSLTGMPPLISSAFAASPEEVEAKCRAEADQKVDADWSEEDKEDWIQLCIMKLEANEPPPEILNLE